MTNTREPWLVMPKPNTDAVLRLFCFPYAGAGASIFRNWAEMVLPEVELLIVQYPGREERYSEPLHDHIDSLIPVLSESLLTSLDKPFVFFGHSLGAGIAHRLLLDWQYRGIARAQHLVVSGARTPQLVSDRLASSQLNDHQFLSLLQARGGMPKELLQNIELMEILMPRLRADFLLAESLTAITDELTYCPISAFGGHRDSEITKRDVHAWCKQTASTFKAWEFKGDHFFIQSSRAQVVEVINQILKLEIQQ